jgi:dipeptidyl aminopeptidase/acylaminoacyl peptidase
MNPDGTGKTRLTNNPAFDFDPSWSPDGTKIAFTSDRDGNQEIYVINAADGTNPRRLTNNPAFDTSPSWSPDGTKIAFTSDRDTNEEIYVMNAADGSEQTNISNKRGGDYLPDWGTAPATEPPEEDTIPPTLTVPDDIIAEANSTEGALVTYTVTAEDNVDGNATLQDDGSTIIQDDVEGDIDISCDPPSGSVFPIGNTTVQCSATDEAGNTGTESFMVTVNPSTPSPPIPKRVIDD